MLFEFELSSATVALDDLEEETRSIILECVEFLQNGDIEKAMEVYQNHMEFFWCWDNCDEEASEYFIQDESEFYLECIPTNSQFRIGLSGEDLVVTARITFELPLKDESNLEESVEAISEYSIDSCGGFWPYCFSDDLGMALYPVE